LPDLSKYMSPFVPAPADGVPSPTMNALPPPPRPVTDDTGTVYPTTSTTTFTKPPSL
jgi:hypothetical protein